jgi:hypothetical protein
MELLRSNGNMTQSPRNHDMLATTKKETGVLFVGVGGD